MQRFSIAAAVLASSLIAAARPALAQSDCGNGVRNFPEDCDDGNVVAGDCCSPTCRFETPGTVCRPASEDCDAAETCTGLSATCPADTGIVGDTDGDSYCDPIDPCPLSADPDPLRDSDGDGIGDACDLCTSALNKVRVFRLRVRKFQRPTGEQRLLFRSDIAIPADPAINPLGKPIRLVMTDALGRTAFDTAIPTISYNQGTRVGWANYDQERWVFADRMNVIPSVDSAILHVTPARESPAFVNVKFKLKAYGDIDVLKPTFPGRLTLMFDTPPVQNSQCAEVRVDSERCAFRNAGNKLYCR